ncbi:substrate-binding domain-containing protein [Clostridium sp.]|uniref:D-xylose ABC transporter substrate-binding protein n=1 Tax=Clostridium sp. TaxID=1506 RepID=UPI002FCACF49
MYTLKTSVNFLSRLLLFSLLIVSNLILNGCDKNKALETRGFETDKDEIVIGFAMDTLVHERWLRDRDIFVARANELGAKVIVQTANSDSVEQEKQVQYLFEQNIDVLVLVPNDADKAANIVRAAKSRGVKVISYDRLVKNSDADLYISFDNSKVGELMGQAALEKAPEGNYLLLNGSKSDNNSFLFSEGYKKELEKGINNGKIEIVGETWINNWLYEDAFKFIEESFKKGTKIDAIIAANDTLAGAALNSLAERRLAGKVTVVGHDADLDGCQRVVEGTQYATVFKPIDKIAKTAAEYAISLAKGQSVETNYTIFDGKYEVPYYKIPPVLVKKGNMKEVIVDSGFHKLEDVYMNVAKSQWPTRNDSTEK